MTTKSLKQKSKHSSHKSHKSRKSNKSHTRGKSKKQSKCEKGYILRKGYSRKTKSGKTIKVKSNCIKATSMSGTKSSDKIKRQLSKLSRQHKKAREMFGTPKCKKGQIIREGYYKKSYVNKSGTKIKGSWVKPRCIRSITGKKHSKQITLLEKGTLGKYGYHDVRHKSVDQRRKALQSALKNGVPHLPIMRKLNILSVLFKNKDPSLHSMYKEDFSYVQNLYNQFKLTH